MDVEPFDSLNLDMNSRDSDDIRRIASSAKLLSSSSIETMLLKNACQLTLAVCPLAPAVRHLKLDSRFEHFADAFIVEEQMLVLPCYLATIDDKLLLDIASAPRADLLVSELAYIALEFELVGFKDDPPQPFPFLLAHFRSRNRRLLDLHFLLLSLTASIPAQYTAYRFRRV